MLLYRVLFVCVNIHDDTAVIRLCWAILLRLYRPPLWQVATHSLVKTHTFWMSVHTSISVATSQPSTTAESRVSVRYLNFELELINTLPPSLFVSLPLLLPLSPSLPPPLLGAEGQSVLVVSVPSFDLTHSCVLVKVGGGKCECEELTFTSSLHQQHNPDLEQMILSQQLAESSMGEEGSGEGGKGEMTLLHLMDEDDDDD